MHMTNLELAKHDNRIFAISVILSVERTTSSINPGSTKKNKFQSVFNMRWLLICVHLIVSVSLCTGTVLCQLFDKNSKTLQKYCGRFMDIFPESCSNEPDFVDPSEVFELKLLRIGGCDNETVLNTIELNSVHTLDISYSGYNFLPMIDLDFMVKLNASHNSLTFVSPELLKNADKLTEIDLSHNNLMTIHEDMFKMASNLIKIDLSHNRIGSFDSNTFRRLQSLTYLDLSWNSIYDERLIGQFNKNLAELHLEENPFNTFYCNDTYKSFASVYYSWKNIFFFYTNSSRDSCFGGKQIHVVSDSKRQGIVQVSNGNIELHCGEEDFNTIWYFQAIDNIFENVNDIMPCLGSSLGRLNVNGNRFAGLETTTFERFTELTNITLRNAQLTHFDFNVIKHLPDLQCIDISYNNLTYLNNSSVLGLFESLVEFNVAGNQLQNVPEIIKYLKPSIQSLDLSGNPIGPSLDNRTFERLNELVTLNLSNTDITNFTPEMLINQRKLIDLDLSNNKFNETHQEDILRTINMQKNESHENISSSDYKIGSIVVICCIVLLAACICRCCWKRSSKTTEEPITLRDFSSNQRLTP